MGLEKLFFEYPDVNIEISSQLKKHEKQALPLYWTEAKLTFPSGSQTKGELVFDSQIEVFITALTDYWERYLDFNAPEDFGLINRSAEYCSDMGETFKILLKSGKINLIDYK